MGGQLDGNFLPGSLTHKFIFIVLLIIRFVENIFFLSLFFFLSLSMCVCVWSHMACEFP